MRTGRYGQPVDGAENDTGRTKVSDKKRVRIRIGSGPYGDLYTPDIFGTKPDVREVILWKVKELQEKIRAGAQRPAKLQSAIDSLAAALALLLTYPKASGLTIKRVDTLLNTGELSRRAAARNTNFGQSKSPFINY